MPTSQKTQGVDVQMQSSGVELAFKIGFVLYYFLNIIYKLGKIQF
jgi:hypothetical protein